MVKKAKSQMDKRAKQLAKMKKDADERAKQRKKLRQQFLDRQKKLAARRKKKKVLTFKEKKERKKARRLLDDKYQKKKPVAWWIGAPKKKSKSIYTSGKKKRALSPKSAKDLQKHARKLTQSIHTPKKKSQKILKKKEKKIPKLDAQFFTKGVKLEPFTYRGSDGFHYYIDSKGKSQRVAVLKKKLPPPPKKPPPPPPAKRTKIDRLKQKRSKENKKTISSNELYKREKSKVLWEQIKILSTSKRPNYKKLLALMGRYRTGSNEPTELDDVPLAKVHIILKNLLKLDKLLENKLKKK